MKGVLPGEAMKRLNGPPPRRQTRYGLNVRPAPVTKRDGATERINTKLEPRAPLCLFNFSSVGNRFRDGSRPGADKF